MGRTYAGTAQKAASSLSLNERGGKPLKIPRGIGLSKREVFKLWPLLKKWKKKWVGFCRVHKVDVVLAATAFDFYFGDEWIQEAKRLGLEESSCMGCASLFFRPKVGGRGACSKRCIGRIRRDSEYFDGMRMNAVGMAEGICQCCLDKPKRGLSAHHVIGKGNDPDNTLMVALCVGCHQLVTDLSLRSFLIDPIAWSRLVRLVLMRQNIRLDNFSEKASFDVQVSWKILSLLQYCKQEGIDPDDFSSVIGDSN
ncbi:MAG: HNH endonuclease [Flavobacteriaceae bacterium]